MRRCAVLVEYFLPDGRKFFAVARVHLGEVEQLYTFDLFDGAILKFGDIESDCEIMQQEELNNSCGLSTLPTSH